MHAAIGTSHVRSIAFCDTQFVPSRSHLLIPSQQHQPKKQQPRPRHGRQRARRPLRPRAADPSAGGTRRAERPPSADPRSGSLPQHTNPQTQLTQRRKGAMRTFLVVDEHVLPRLAHCNTHQSSHYQQAGRTTQRRRSAHRTPISWSASSTDCRSVPHIAPQSSVPMPPAHRRKGRALLLNAASITA